MTLMHEKRTVLLLLVHLLSCDTTCRYFHSCFQMKYLPVCMLKLCIINNYNCSTKLFIYRPQASFKPGMRFCSFKTLRAQIIVAEARLNRIYSFSLLGHLTNWYSSSSLWVPLAQPSIFAVLCADSFSQCETCPIPTGGSLWLPSTVPAGGSLGEIWGF